MLFRNMESNNATANQDTANNVYQNDQVNRFPVATEPETSDINTVTTHEESPKVQENKVAERKNQDPEETAPEQPVEIPSIRLSEEEQAKLEKLEDKIKDSVAEGWKALAEIQNYEGGKLWKSNYATFEDYVESRFDFNRKHSMRLVEAGRFLLTLEKAKSKSPCPTRESHMREITQKLPESHHVSFWDQYCTNKSITVENISEVTAKDIKEAVTEYRKQIPEDELPVKPPRENKVKVPLVEKIRTKSLALLEKVMDLVQELPERDAIALKLEELEELING